MELLAPAGNLECALAAFDADSDDTLTESIDFTVERFEMPEKFTMMDGMM